MQFKPGLTSDDRLATAGYAYGGEATALRMVTDYLLVYGAGYDLLHQEVAGLSRRLLCDYTAERLGSSERLTKSKSHHTVGEIQRIGYGWRTVSGRCLT